MGQRIVNKKFNSVNLGFKEKFWQAVALRDVLLPKLVSGEVRVKDSENNAEIVS